MTNVFIDGSAGTTGLRIHERLAKREDISCIILPDACRKDPDARHDAMKKADVVFLCLPDAAAIEAVSLADDVSAAIIDTSTAHRTASDWVYGMAELEGQRERICSSKRIANPGCHASGFVALVAPLVFNGLLKQDAKLSCFSLTGYSGGGKAMIADYESKDLNPLLKAPRQYGLAQMHKHLPEMRQMSGLEYAPVFCPIVSDYYSGMEVTVPLFASDCKGTIEDIRQIYAHCYQSKVLHYDSHVDENGFVSANVFAGRDDMQVTICGNEERVLLIARFDNLGKGASGAAIQNMNILLGCDETLGLNV